MKKLIYFLASALFVMQACGKLDGENGPVITNKGDILVGKKEVLDPDTQKEKLEQIGGKMLTVFQAEEFEGLLEISEAVLSHCDKYYDSSDYDWTELEEVTEDLYDDFVDATQISYYEWEYNYTIFLSNCTGTLTFGKDEVTYDKSKDTKVIFEDVDGDDWEATLTYKDTKEVFLGEWTDAWYEYEDTYSVTVQIPKTLSFSLKRNGKDFGKVDASFDYNISKGGFDPEKDSFGVSLTVSLDNLTAKLEDCKLNGKTGDASYAISLWKDGMFIASWKVNGNASYDVDEDYGVTADKANATVECNVLGELQVKGTCENLVKLSEIIEDYYESSRECERGAEKANDLMSLNVYYDCTSTVQATIEFEAMAEKEYGYEYHWIEPVIVFEDGSRYSFDKYFRERDFRDLIGDFEDFIYDYEDMIEDIY